MPQEPMQILVEATPPEEHDLNEHHHTLLSSIAQHVKNLGHTVHKVVVSHGSIRGGSKAHVPAAAADEPPATS
jgi:hypothetical protein